MESSIVVQAINNVLVMISGVVALVYLAYSACMFLVSSQKKKYPLLCRIRLHWGQVVLALYAFLIFTTNSDWMFMYISIIAIIIATFNKHPRLEILKNKEA